MHPPIKAVAAGGLSLILAGGCQAPEQNTDSPNILWIIAEDMSPDFSCYGSEEIRTPYVDSLASLGTRFSNAHVTAPVCSASRSALVTGMYQTSIGTHNHRSSRGSVKIFLPAGVKMIPQLFRDAGYFTANAGFDYGAKTDYNFVWNEQVYDATPRLKGDGSDWDLLFRGRSEDQPWFVQLQLAGGKNRRPPIEDPVSPGAVKVQPYYPDTQTFREDRASYLNSVLYTDKLVGNIMDALQRSGELENTVIFFFTDHGQDLYRDKQYLYDGGTHVPLIVTGENFAAGEVNDELVLHIDVAATSLELAGIEKPAYLQGRSFSGDKHVPRSVLISARDRCDWTKDRIRSVRTADMKYIRNFHPEFPYMQSQYREQWPTVLEAKKLFREGNLTDAAARFFMDERPVEELYDLTIDPYEINNLAGMARYADTLAAFRSILDQWIKETGDRGEIPESEASYEEALLNINTGTPFHNFPLETAIGILNSTGQANLYTSTLVLENTSDTDLEVSYDWKLPGGVSMDNPTGISEVPPGNRESISFSFRSTKSLTATDTLELNWNTIYSFPDGDQLPVKGTYRLVIPEHHEAVPAIKRPLVDGKPDDWGQLKYSFSQGDGAVCSFDCSHADGDLYIGVLVHDDRVNSEKGVMPWLQDGLEIRIDVRQDPERSSNPAVNESIDHMLFASSPGTGSAPATVYRDGKVSIGCPGLFDEGGAVLAHSIVPGGHFAELLVPDTFMRHWGQDPWDSFRLNIIVHDTDTGGVRARYSWLPDWREKERQVVGSGTFVKI